MKGFYMKQSKSIIFIFLSLTFIMSGCTDYTSEKHVLHTNPINNENIGFIVQGNDGTIYYQDGKNNNAITQMNKSGNNVFEDTYGMCLSVYDKYIYYRDFNNGLNLMRLEIANPEKKEAITDINTLQAIIIDEMIYALIFDVESDKDGLYRISLDGSKKKKLDGAASNCMQYEGDYIYYAAQQKGQLYRIDLNGKNKKVILSETGEYISTSHFIVKDGWIYFNNGNQDDGKDIEAVDSTLNICRIRIDGTDFEELVDGFISNIYSASDKDSLLYLFEGKLYSLNLESKESELLLDKDIHFVNVIDNIIYAIEWGTENNDSIIYRIDMENKVTTILGE